MSLSNEELIKINPVDNLQSRLNWDEYFVSLAFLISLRSFDPSSKCGCVIVDKNHRILTSGYNGPIKNSNDIDIPLIRPDRYSYMIHAEDNALLSYYGSYQDIQNSIAYITTRPCSKCLRSLLQKGITTIIYPLTSTMVVNSKDISIQDLMIKNRNINITEIPIKQYNIILQKVSDRFK